MDKADILSAYLPEKAVPLISHWIDVYQVQLKIARRRRTKLGDYRPPHDGHPHRISVNHDLNPYAFLVTLVHEFAHLVAWNHHGRKALSHGPEWKALFRRMMQPFFGTGAFPADLEEVLQRYLRNPAAASCTDLSLLRALKRYDLPGAAALTVEQLPEGALFGIAANGGSRFFKKGQRLRKRYRCTEIATGRVYLFNPLAEVTPAPAAD